MSKKLPRRLRNRRRRKRLSGKPHRADAKKC